MNNFIGIGTIVDVDMNGKALKFNLSLQQDRPCVIPCIIFDPNNEIKELLAQSEATVQTVWLQGRIISNEYEFNGKTVRKISVMTYPSNIRPIE